MPRRLNWSTAAISLIFAASLASDAIAGSSAVSGSVPLKIVSDFENQSLDGWNVSGNSPTISTEHVRSGKYSIKSVLNRATSAVSYRTEIRSLAPTPKFGEDVWYGFSIYLPSPYPSDPIWEILAQWHGTPDANLGESAKQNPPMALDAGNGDWAVTTRWDANAVSDNHNYGGTKTYDLGPYEVDTWTDWVFHVRWSFGPDGLLQVWKNGVKVIDVTGPIGFNDAVVPYFKMGIYKGWRDPSVPGVVTTRTMYHDAFRMAIGPSAAYADVAPGGSAAQNPPMPATPLAPGNVSVQ